MKHQAPITSDWRTEALRLATTEPEWEEAGPGNSWHAGPRFSPACDMPNLYTRDLELKHCEADIRVYIDRNGCIKAGNWCCVSWMNGKDRRPWGSGHPVEIIGATVQHGSDWSWINPETAIRAAWLALAWNVEEKLIEAEADGPAAAQADCVKVREWCNMQSGFAIRPLFTAAERHERATERRAWLDGRRAEEIEQRKRQAEQAANAKQAPKKSKVVDSKEFDFDEDGQWIDGEEIEEDEVLEPQGRLF